MDRARVAQPGLTLNICAYGDYYGIVITIGIFTRTKVAWTNPSTSVRVLLNPSVTRRSIYSLFEVLVLAGSSVLKSTSTCGYCPASCSSADMYTYVVYFCIRGIRIRAYAYART